MLLQDSARERRTWRREFPRTRERPVVGSTASAASFGLPVGNSAAISMTSLTPGAYPAGTGEERKALAPREGGYDDAGARTKHRV